MQHVALVHHGDELRMYSASKLQPWYRKSSFSMKHVGLPDHRVQRPLTRALSNFIAGLSENGAHSYMPLFFLFRAERPTDY